MSKLRQTEVELRFCGMESVRYYSHQAPPVRHEEVCWDSGCIQTCRWVSPRAEEAWAACPSNKTSLKRTLRNKYRKDGGAYELDSSAPNTSPKVLSSKEWKKKVLAEQAESGVEDPYRKVVFKSRYELCRALDHQVKCRHYGHDPHT